MTEPTPRPTPVKGIACPECRGVRLHVCKVVRPAPGRTVRYRKCTACGHRIVTEERVRPAGNK